MEKSDRTGAPGLAARAAAWSLELVAVPSVNGTPEEASFAEWLRARLATLPVFAASGIAVWNVPVPGDPLGRAAVAALVRGRGSRTVILTGHFDTVHTDDYGPLARLATQPHALAPALLARLGEDGGTPAERRARADLASGDFLPGRGLLDMKSGLGAGLAVLEAFAGEPGREGNLLFLAVPDEEANSAGARAAAGALPEMAARLGLSLDAALNLDAMIDDGAGEAARVVALGTIGKLLPSAFVVGEAVHAANALGGRNAGALAGEIAGAVEWSPALTDERDGERAPPPTLLGLKDGRVRYDVTTPEHVWAYWNVMTLGRRPEAVLATFGELCEAAVQRAAERLAGRAGHVAGHQSGGAVPVLTFEALRHEVLERDPGAGARLAEMAREVAGRGLDIPEQCRLLTDAWWAASRRSGPAVVIGFASLPYLPTGLKGAAGMRLEGAVREAAAWAAARHGTTIGVTRTFPGISDMSYLGQADTAAVPAVAANTPAWGFGIEWPAGPGAAGVPMVNAGPWGRDYHTPLERLHTGYAFEVLPELLLRIVRNVLRPG